MALALVMEKVAKTDDKDSFQAAKLVLENEGKDLGYGGSKSNTVIQDNQAQGVIVEVIKPGEKDAKQKTSTERVNP